MTIATTTTTTTTTPLTTQEPPQAPKTSQEQEDHSHPFQTSLETLAFPSPIIEDIISFPRIRTGVPLEVELPQSPSSPQTNLPSTLQTVLPTKLQGAFPSDRTTTPIPLALETRTRPEDKDGALMERTISPVTLKEAVESSSSIGKYCEEERVVDGDERKGEEKGLRSSDRKREGNTGKWLPVDWKGRESVSSNVGTGGRAD